MRVAMVIQAMDNALNHHATEEAVEAEVTAGIMETAIALFSHWNGVKKCLVLNSQVCVLITKPYTTARWLNELMLLSVLNIVCCLLLVVSFICNFGVFLFYFKHCLAD